MYTHPYVYSGAVLSPAFTICFASILIVALKTVGWKKFRLVDLLRFCAIGSLASPLAKGWAVYICARLRIEVYFFKHRLERRGGILLLRHSTHIKKK